VPSFARLSALCRACCTCRPPPSSKAGHSPDLVACKSVYSRPSLGITLHDDNELETRLFLSGDSAAATMVNVVVATSPQVKVIAFNIILFFFYSYLKFRSIDGFQCFLRLISDQDFVHTFVFDVVFIMVC
jgi:hypothetical protein